MGDFADGSFIRLSLKVRVGSMCSAGNPSDRLQVEILSERLQVSNNRPKMCFVCTWMNNLKAKLIKASAIIMPH